MTKWIIDAGHGGNDSGAVSTVKEKDLTLQISLYQYKRLKELGVNVSLTRCSDITLDSKSRIAKVNSLGGKKDYCISNHINAGKGTGVETIYSIYSNKTLAEELLNAVSEASGLKKRRAYTKTQSDGNDYYYMHRETKAKTVIVEYGFIDTPSDLKTIQEKWQEMAEAVVKVVCEKEGIKYTQGIEKYYRVQVGAFKNKSGAEALAKDLKTKGYASIVVYNE